MTRPAPASSSIPWDSDALWTKAKLFINYVLDDEPERGFDERALWASLALELLGKAALARANPLLIASPTEDGKNLLAAAGLTDDRATFKTIAGSTVFKRCALAFKPFSEAAAVRIADDRNAYLHSAMASFSLIPEEAWWPRFWALAHVLVNACDRDLDQFVGSAHVGKVEAALAQNQRNVEERVHMLLDRARQRLARYETGEMRGAELRDWERSTSLIIGGQYAAPATCPACGEDEGTLEGDDVISTEVEFEQVGHDDYDVWLELEVAADYFSCARCRCVLDSFALLQAAGLPESFGATGDPDEFQEPDYGND